MVRQFYESQLETVLHRVEVGKRLFKIKAGLHGCFLIIRNFNNQFLIVAAAFSIGGFLHAAEAAGVLLLLK
jgi:hypothetical protein